MIYRVTGDHQENNENNGRLFLLASTLSWLIPIPRLSCREELGRSLTPLPWLSMVSGQPQTLHPGAPWAVGHSECSEISPSLGCSRHTHTATLNYSKNKSTLPLHSNIEERFNHILQVLGHKEFFMHRTCRPKMTFKVIIIHRWGVRFADVFMRGKTTERPLSSIKSKFFLFFKWNFSSASDKALGNPMNFKKSF